MQRNLELHFFTLLAIIISDTSLDLLDIKKSAVHISNMIFICQHCQLALNLAFHCCRIINLYCTLLMQLS